MENKVFETEVSLRLKKKKALAWSRPDSFTEFYCILLKNRCIKTLWHFDIGLYEQKKCVDKGVIWSHVRNREYYGYLSKFIFNDLVGFPHVWWSYCQCTHILRVTWLIHGKMIFNTVMWYQFSPATIHSGYKSYNNTSPITMLLLSRNRTCH